MANSGYHLEQYNFYKNQASGYERNIKELTKIKNNLTGSFGDEQSNVNRELSDLRDDLGKAVRHDGNFSANANECEQYREKAVTADSDLNRVLNALEDEIRSLEGKKQTAEQNRDRQWKTYSEEKEKEHQEWLDSLVKK